MHHPPARPPPAGGSDETRDGREHGGVDQLVDHVHAAQLCVATHAVDSRDARVLLDMLGLLHLDPRRDDEPSARVQPHHPGAPRIARP